MKWNKGDRVAVAVMDGTQGYIETGRIDHGRITGILGGRLDVEWDDGTDCSIPASAALPPRIINGCRVIWSKNGFSIIAHAAGFMLYNGFRIGTFKTLDGAIRRAQPSQAQYTIDTIDCHVCGHDFFITDAGVAHHVEEDAPDGIDHMLDEDHVPYVID